MTGRQLCALFIGTTLGAFVSFAVTDRVGAHLHGLRRGRVWISDSVAFVDDEGKAALEARFPALFGEHALKLSPGPTGLHRVLFDNDAERGRRLAAELLALSVFKAGPT